MGNIVLLDDLTINKIAAGEVIERPASVVKEMVENSIDAGANNITVEIKNGGISFIKVTDNGKGILPDDMEIAFERHATSKIRSAEDLDIVTSMGFRGEALASVAAISNIEMISKTEEQNIGYKITVEAGNILNKEETACPTGTSIIVRNLFFNTPVRYKFLKKDYTESGYIEDAITRIALAHPEISIKLINTGKTVIQTNGNGDIKAVIYSIYGKDIAKEIIPINYEYEDIKITGVVGKPEISRSNRSNQIFFVNKRYIKDKTLTAATTQAYKGLIPIGKYGFVVLNIEMNPSKVDVNVHPAKLEVRFEEESKIFQSIYHAIKDSLLKGEKPNEIETKKIIQNQQTIIDKNNINENIKFENENEKQRKESIFEKATRARRETEPKINFEQDNSLNEKEKLNFEQNNSLNEKEEINFDEMYTKLFGTKPIHSEEKVAEDSEEYKIVDAGDIAQENIEIIEQSESEVQENEYEEPVNMKEENISVFEETEEYKKPTYKFIGIAFNKYIIIEMNKEMYIVNQKLAQEKLLYEEIKESYYNEKLTNSQLMLLPDIITLTTKQMDIAKDNTLMFEKAGFYFEDFGDNTLKLTKVPDICMEIENSELFVELLKEINTIARTEIEEKEKKLIKTIAKNLVENKKLTSEDAIKIIDKLLEKDNPFGFSEESSTSAIKMTKYDIERKFARK